MNWQYTPFAVPLQLIAIGSLWLAYRASRRRRGPLTLSLTLLAASIAWWSFFYALELAGVGLESKLLWARVQYLGIVVAPLSWLLLAAAHVRAHGLFRPRLVAALSLVPALTLLAVWTNNVHHWLWRASSITPDGAYLVGQYGPLFWLHTTVAYLYVLGGCGLMLSTFREQARRLFRWQSGLLLLGILFPWLGNTLFLFNLSPFPHLDLTPFAFALGLGLLTAAILRFHLLDIIPIARSAVLDAMQDAMLVIGLEGELLDFNRAAAALQPELGSIQAGQPLPPSLRQVVATMMGPETAGTKRSREISLGEGDGFREFRLRLSAVRDLHGNLLGHLLLLNDVTEHNSLQRLRDDMTRTMVHDLRAPISNIAGTLQWLEETAGAGLNQEGRALLSLSRSSAGKVLDLIGAILDISRLESRQWPLVFTEFTLGPLVEQVVAGHAATAAARGIDLTGDVPPALPPVLADYGLAERVLQNLVHNAVKFAPEGGEAAIRASLSQEMPAKLLVMVHNSGPGVSPALQAHLFDQFVTGDQPERGSGLGLAFCKMALEAHGESIWLDGSSAQGTTICFTLPVSASSPVLHA